MLYFQWFGQGGYEAHQGRRTMAGFATMEVIDRTPEEVFAFMTNLSKASCRLSDLVSLEPLTRGPMRRCYRWKEVRRVGGREGATVAEVMEFKGPGEGKKPPYIFAVRTVKMGIEGTYHYRLEHEGKEKTRIEMTAIVRGANLISQLLVPLFTKTMKKQDGAQLHNLKKALEAGPRTAVAPPVADPATEPGDVSSAEELTPKRTSENITVGD